MCEAPHAQFSMAMSSLLSMAIVLFQCVGAEAPLGTMSLVLRCSKSQRCCCTVVTDSLGGVLFGCMVKRMATMRGSRHATAWSSACIRFVGRGAVGAAVFAWGTAAVQHSGAVTSEQVVKSVDLMHRVTMGFAFTIRLPSVAAMSHLVVHSVMEPQLFDLRALLGCGNCTIH